jgi:uncharacterized protein
VLKALFNKKELRRIMLKDLMQQITSYPGITRKRDIYKITSALADMADFGNTAIGFGDDAAAIYHNGEYLLLAADGIWSGLIEANPYGAGKASVMASVNDVYAMGGRPLAMVNVIGIPDASYYDEIVKGIRKGCEKFRVPMVGGHLHPDTREASLSVAILGSAKKLLRSDNAIPGQDLIFAVDLEGRGFQCKPVLSWDTNSGKTSEQALARLNILPLLAEKSLCATCKDVSNGGLLGTIALLLETSKAGAIVNIDCVPRPLEFRLTDWLKAFLSYGFILTVNKEVTSKVIDVFSQQHITARVIGTIISERRLHVSLAGEQGILFDLVQDPITGIITD